MTGASLGYCHVRSTRLNKAFGKVVVGESEPDVVGKMGRPHRIVEGCGYYYGRPIDEAWLIAFDAGGAVSHTAYFVSP